MTARQGFALLLLCAISGGVLGACYVPGAWDWLAALAPLEFAALCGAVVLVAAGIALWGTSE